MREIKFRFWNKLARTYKRSWRNAICYDGKFIEYDPDMMEYDDPIDFSKSIVVAQQYTGFKDRNGKEVYEGDLVECDDGLRGRMYGEVVYDNDYGAFRIVFTDLLQWTFYKAENIEVIGNIFENPELLK
jgi:uncharacterized phage protein (TIGR01671 family)